jgi:predicted kinase
MVIIFRGTSGSGKSALIKLFRSIDFTLDVTAAAAGTASHYVKSLWAQVWTNCKSRDGVPDILVVSADKFFMVNGEYKFDASKLGEAHNSCLRHYVDEVSMPRNRDAIIVDNTNCTIAEVMPYAALAGAYRHDLHIITLLGDPEKAWKRNHHGAPFENVVRQDLCLRQSILDWPAWIPQKIFPQ